MSKNYDIIVVGNGVIGYSVAYALMSKNKNLRIAIVGPKSKPGCASVAAGAMLASFAEMEYKGLDHPTARFKFELTIQSTKMWPAWAQEINERAGEKIIDIQLGSYVICNAKADQFDDLNFQATIDNLKYYKEPHEIVNPADIVGYSPEPDSRALAAIYIPNEGFFPSDQIPRAFEIIWQNNKNIDLLDDTVTKVNTNGSKVTGVDLKSNISLAAPLVVVANGSKSQELFDQIPDLADKMPRLFYGVGTGIVLETEQQVPEKVVRTTNRGLACGVHLVPYSKNSCYIGASNFISPVAEYVPRITSLYSLLQAAMEQVHTKFYKARIAKTVVGHRPTSADTYPLIGPTSLDGLWVLTGTKRDGIHMSPLYAQSLARQICGEKPIFENKFLPERKLIHTMTKKEGIIKAVHHLNSAAYQHELKLPKSGWNDMVVNMLQNKVESIYQKCGVEDFGIPPEMLDMYQYGHVKVR